MTSGVVTALSVSGALVITTVSVFSGAAVSTEYVSIIDSALADKASLASSVKGKSSIFFK